VCALRPGWRWQHPFLRGKGRLVSCPRLQTSTGPPLFSVVQNYSPKIRNHPIAFLSEKGGPQQASTNPMGNILIAAGTLEC